MNKDTVSVMNTVVTTDPDKGKAKKLHYKTKDYNNTELHAPLELLQHRHRAARINGTLAKQQHASVWANF